MKKKLKNMGVKGGEERTRIFKRFLKETGLYSQYIRDRLQVKKVYNAKKLKVFSPCANYGIPWDVLYKSFPANYTNDFHYDFWKYVRSCLVCCSGYIEFEDLLNEYIIDNVKLIVINSSHIFDYD